MTRTNLCLSPVCDRATSSSRLFGALPFISVFALGLFGCAKNNNDTQNPDTTGGHAGSGDHGDGGGDGDSASTPSRARKSTAPRGAGRNTAARQVTAKKPPRAPDEELPDNTPTPHGLVATAYALDSADALPNFASLGAPAQTFVVPNLDYDEVPASAGFPGLSALKSNYALRFVGSINIVEEAEYELCLHSDDGSQLLLEDTLVVDNDGVHDGPVETCELVYLAPGEYGLEVRYFQADGDLLAMHMAWAIDGGAKVIIPTDVLYKP
jgi:hypothetical protein